MAVIQRIGETSRRRLIPAIAMVLAAAVVLAVAGTSASGRGVNGLHVFRNRILDKDGRRVLLQGVNRSGTEYACVQGWGIFDGPDTASSVQAMATWHVNVVRVPLNEDCWLGINGIKPQYGGASYREAIAHYVGLLHRYGMYAEVSLMWAAPGFHTAAYQPAAPDEDHAPRVWAGMASTFRHDRNVILAPWGETTVSAGCFLKGGCQAAYFPPNAPTIRYRAAGMQQAVKVMRHAGYRGIIAIPGLDYANDLSQWLSHRPHDPRHQLIAEAHVYGGNPCEDAQCFQATYAPVAHRVPLIFGEAGEGTGCGTPHISTVIHWADAHRVGYEAWAWDAWGSCSALIQNYGGAPANAYGHWIQSHYLGRRPRLIPKK